MTNIINTDWQHNDTHIWMSCAKLLYEKDYVLNNRKKCYQKIPLCTTLGRFKKCAVEKKGKIRNFAAATLTFILTLFSLTSSSLDFRLPSHCYPELADRRDFAFSISTFQQQQPQAPELILKIHLVEQWARLRVLVVTQTAKTCQTFLQAVSLIHLPLLQYSNGPVLVCCGLTAWLHTHLDAHPTSVYKGQPH